MDRMRVFANGLFGLTIGATPGLWVYAETKQVESFSLVIVGGLLGLGLGVSRALYNTSPWTALRRAMKVFLHLMIYKNLPGAEDLLVDLSNEQKIDELIPNSGMTDEQLTSLFSRLAISACVGAALCGGGTLVASLILPYPVEINDPFEQLTFPFLSALVGIVAGALYGAAFGMFTVAGRHRWSILVGWSAGFLIGLALGLATRKGAKDPNESMLVIAFAFATFGLICGIFAPENYLVRDAKGDQISYDASEHFDSNDDLQ